MIRRLALAPALLALASPLGAQGAPPVGTIAPSISLESWLNVGKDESPSLESLKGKPILLEFWGTWCHPCVLAMPIIQKLHDRYRDRGLRVLAISYEAPEVMEPFLKQNAYTMSVGSDPTKKVVTAYGVRGWPTSVLIDKDGKVAHVGTPYDIEPAIEKALGIEATPASLLTSAVDALAAKDKKAARDALQRLVDKEPDEFDLKAWSTDAGGAAPAKGDAKGDPNDALTKCVAAWNAKEPAARTAALNALAAVAPASFDLASWARRRFGAEFPITDKEAKDLLDAKNHDAIVEALIDRSPSAAIVAAVVKSKELKDYSTKKAQESRTFATKGLMVQNWVLAGKQAKDNKAFWAELNVNGIAMTEDKKSVKAILIGPKSVNRSNAGSFVRHQLARALVMESLAAGKDPKLAALEAAITKDRDAELKRLESRYPVEK